MNATTLIIIQSRQIRSDQVKTLRGGNGRRSHDEARPWGGLGFDVKSNTYASESGVDNPDGAGAPVGRAGAAAASAAWASPESRRSSTGATPRKGMEASPGGRARGEGLIERLLGARGGTPKY